MALRWLLLAAWLGGSTLVGWSQSSLQPLALEPGIIASFSNDNKSEHSVVLPELSLYIQAGQAPTPFQPADGFKAVLSGYLSCELRGEYRFQAKLNGACKLDINGVNLLTTNAQGGMVEPSRPIRLNKGTNAVRLEFSSPTHGDAYVRIYWIPKGGLAVPVPSSALGHREGSETLAAAAQLALGRELFLNHRCVRCHQGPAAESGALELATDAPSLEGIGARRNYAWMAHWILDPKSERASARMPRLFHAPQASEQAQACAAFLASLRGSDNSSAPPAAASTGDVQSGKRLFDDLHCVACHLAPDSTESDPERLSLKQVARKFAPGALALFLQKPRAHYLWIRMPDFKLRTNEAANLSAFLLANAASPEADAAPTDAGLLERGKKLVQTSGCLNCHSLKLANEFTAKPLANLPAPRWEHGCMAAALEPNSKAPFFAFSPSERQALQQFAASDRLSLTRNVPAEFAQRQIHELRCLACHGKFDGFPGLEHLGEKLKPEWTQAFLAGEIPYKPRPWLDARMPAFPAYAGGLAAGLASLQGCPPSTPAEPPIDQAAAKIGQKLVSADGGLICISCHAIGRVPATQVFENAGVNLAYTTARLRRPYFERWVRNPLALDPVTKMPVFFDEQLRSPLVDFYGGDGAKQIDAIWQYLRLGPDLPPPPGAQPGS